jgi:hypothetical protein
MKEKVDQATCKHKFRVAGVLGLLSKELRCPKCDLRQEIPLTKDEVRGMKKQHKFDNEHIHEIHSLGWAYQKEFYKYVKVRVTAKDRKSFGKMKLPKFWINHAGFKYKGYEMMQRMEAFAEKHPDVRLCRCDDAAHTGSMVAFIPHRTETEYWGTTVVCIPQFSGEPTELFFYPHHAIEIEKVLLEFNREWRQKRKFEVREERYWPKP